MLEGVRGEPLDPLGARQAQIDRRAELVLAVPGARRAAALLDRPEQARLFAVRSERGVDAHTKPGLVRGAEQRLQRRDGELGHAVFAATGGAGGIIEAHQRTVGSARAADQTARRIQPRQRKRRGGIGWRFVLRGRRWRWCVPAGGRERRYARLARRRREARGPWRSPRGFAMLRSMGPPLAPTWSRASSPRRPGRRTPAVGGPLPARSPRWCRAASPPECGGPSWVQIASWRSSRGATIQEPASWGNRRVHVLLVRRVPGVDVHGARRGRGPGMSRGARVPP